MQTNLRYHNRLDTQFDATLKTSMGATAFGTIANLSKAGVMIECDRQAIEDIIPKNNPPARKNPIRLEVRFQLNPDQSSEPEVVALCDIVHVRRKSRDTYQVGVEFDYFPNNDYNALEQYVNHRLHQE